jgi:peptide-methionine (S)-S-oxide reductase
VDQLTKAKSFSRPIVTEISALDRFNVAEAYHQDYAALHPYQPYIMIHDAPKVANLKKEFAALYVEPRKP